MATSQVTSLRIPQDLKDWAQEQARSENRSLGNWIVKMMQDRRHGDAAAPASRRDVSTAGPSRKQAFEPRLKRT